MIVLGIETSCDDTAAAVVEEGPRVLSSIVASQVETHRAFGGVVPELASRRHIEALSAVVEEAIAGAGIAPGRIDAVAATRGPGLVGSLLVGFSFAKGYAWARGLPLAGVNHLEAHIHALFLEDRPPAYPFVSLLVSGGHTALYLVSSPFGMELLGQTRDDAAGEAFDKVARLLELGYPGGPAIQSAAEEGDAGRFNFPRAWLDGTYDFSFSGLKTAVLYETRELKKRSGHLPAHDLAASFQKAVVDVLFKKTMDAAREFGAKEILVAGGVSANRALRQAFRAQGEFPVHIPPLSLCTDNAAMIASAGYYRFALGHVSDLDIDVLPTWNLSQAA